MCRGVAGNIPGRRLARRAGRIHVGGRLRGSRTRARGGGLVDRPESVVVVVSTGRSRSSRGSLHASPGCTVEEQASQGRHPFAVSMGFARSHWTSRRSPRSPIKRDALPTNSEQVRPPSNHTTPVARARRELSGDVRTASGAQRGAEEWGRERGVREKGCPTPYAPTRVKTLQPQ